MMTSEENEVPVSASHEIDIMKYVSYRRSEIELLTSETSLRKAGKKPNKSLFQLLPRHMRRRTMGFIRKRLPHRIRQAAVIKPPSKVNKRPSRKYRRKPKKLLSEYERRKRAVSGRMWLETHIWHAKRFHMSDSLFGYRLALFDNCKAKRAVFRALKSGCCLHDESYYVCHEITGSQEALISGLNRLCSSHLGLTFAAKMLTGGRFEGRVILYEADQYPFGCIGPCRFIWKPTQQPESGDNNTPRTLWLWTHPSIYLDVQKQLVNVWNMSPVEDEARKEDESPKNKKIKLGTDALISNAIKFKSSCGFVQLECLKDNLIRFKLVGPLSTTILANVLKTFDPSNMNSLELGLYEKQIELWDKMKLMIRDPNEIVSSTVLGLLVKDPRLALPKKKSFNQINDQNQRIDARKSQIIKQEVNEEIRKSILSYSQIWDKNVIDSLNSAKKTTHEINKLRQEYLVPGSQLTQVENHSKIPIILVQNSSTTNSAVASIRNGNLSSGWDLIVPKTWAMPFWMCLVHCGARAIGQAELNYLAFESGNLQFPNEYIDTKSSENELDKAKQTLYAKHERRPASKRVNFIRQRFLTPFYHPIRGVLSLSLGMNHLTAKYFILRDKSILSKIQSAYFNSSRTPKLAADSINMEQLKHSYIAVRLQCDSRGTLDNFSLVYEYSEKTVDEDEKNESNLIMRSILEDHKRECIKRVAAATSESNTGGDKKKKVTLNKLIRSKCNPNELLLTENAFLKFQRDLSDSKSFHQPIGFVINGGFNLASGKYTANGFVLTKSILDSIEGEKRQARNAVLFKTPTCDIYKTARITHIFN